jgi:hypothetical protein
MSVTSGVAVHPETYDDFAVGDEVWCLAWIGVPFTVAAKLDEIERLELRAGVPCSLPEGAGIDINPSNMFMVTHNLWDQIWYWPDRCNERYSDVVSRFIDEHPEGKIVTGYHCDPGMPLPVASLRKAAAFRLSYAALDSWNEIQVQPVAATRNGEIIRAYDPAIPDDQWVECATPAPLRLGMQVYRWALRYGDVILNWSDF